MANIYVVTKMTRMFGLATILVASALSLSGCIVAAPPEPYYSGAYVQPGYVVGPAIVIGGGGYYGHGGGYGGGYYGHGGGYGGGYYGHGGRR